MLVEPKDNSALDRKIREANVRIHDLLADSYDDLHAEVRNWLSLIHI